MKILLTQKRTSLILLAIFSLTLFQCQDIKLSAAMNKPNQVSQDGSPIFESANEEEYLFANHKSRYQVFGTEKMKAHFSNKRAGDTVAIQFTDRKRLYDHNILLAAIFAGRINHIQCGNLGNRFQGSLFFDLGSAVLYRGGAPTVRDIFEDKKVFPHLSHLVASDINDDSSAKTQFINIYRKQKAQLPFPVEEIDMSITTPEQVKKMISKYVSNETSPIIFRTVNTGIDYFYKEDELKKHFQAVLASMDKRDFIYFFNRFILFKPQEGNKFQIIGEIFERMFAAEKGKNWRKTFWTKRKLQDGFIPNKKYLTL
jgi:hypothetical protein